MARIQGRCPPGPRLRLVALMRHGFPEDSLGVFIDAVRKYGDVVRLHSGPEYFDDKTRRVLRAPERIPSQRHRRFRRSFAALDRIIDGVIDGRRRGEGFHDDLLSRCCGRPAHPGEDREAARRQVRDEVATFIRVGYETPAVALAWTWHCIASSPDVELTLHFAHFFNIWSEERNFAILRRCQAALTASGSVVIFNMMQADDETGPLVAAMGSPYFLTLATGEGMLCTWAEYETWLREAGFSVVTRQRLLRNHGVVIGTRPAGPAEVPATPIRA